jgi:hypothetical protein
MQQITLCFCAALGVLLAISCFVDAQEVVLISDADITPPATVSFTQAFLQITLFTRETYKGGRRSQCPRRQLNMRQIFDIFLEEGSHY